MKNNDPYLKGHAYHIFNRGCNRERIFFTDANYVYLLKKIKETHGKYGANLIAYCLMPNHYHFLVQQQTDRPLSDWLQNIFNGYSQAINKQERRSGTLFQGRPKNIDIYDDRYFIQLALYIHYNPVEAGLVKKPEDWLYSNYLEWAGKRNGSLVDREMVNAYFRSPADYEKLMTEYDLEKSLKDDKLESFTVDFVK